jgi:vacuolar-type H+-ATPase subunit I/STV1
MAGQNDSDDGGYGEREGQRVTTLAKLDEKVDRFIDKVEKFIEGGGHARPDNGPSRPAGGPPPAGPQTQAQRAEVSRDQLRDALGDLRKQEQAEEEERAAAQKREDRLSAVEKAVEREKAPEELRWLTSKMWG